VALKILHAIHDFLPRHRAGSEIYALDLCRELSRRHEVGVLCAEYDPSQPHGSVVSRRYEGLAVRELINNWAFSDFSQTYGSATINAALDQILAEERPDVLHVHNLLNLSFDLPTLARARGIPSVATLHDFTLVCPSGGQRVHIAEEHVCYDIDPDRCRRCFTQSPFHSQLAGGAAGLPCSAFPPSSASSAPRARSCPWPPERATGPGAATGARRWTNTTSGSGYACSGR